MILGFIGTGKISSSIIYGIFKSKLKVKKIYISSRNTNIAKKLSSKFRVIKVLKDNQESKKTPIIKKQKISRNAPCTCGSGKKYKHCHGRNR